MKNYGKKERYKKMCKMGYGTYGVVYKAQDMVKNQIVALKKIKIPEEYEGTPVTALRYVTLLQSLDHPNIVKIYGVEQYNSEGDRHRIYISMEFVPETLSQYIARSHPMSPYAVRVKSNIIYLFIYQLLQAEHYLACRGIMHRDLKPTNILVCENGRLKLCDFGLAKHISLMEEQLTPGVGTLWYRAPEILMGSAHYSLAAYIWSLGCILVYMGEGKAPFKSPSYIGQIFEILKYLGTPSPQSYPDFFTMKHYSPRFPRFYPSRLPLSRFDSHGRHFISQMLYLNPQNRMTIRYALNHPYLEGCCF